MGRFRLCSNLIKPCRSIKFDKVRFASINKTFDLAFPVMLARDLEQLSFPFFHISLPEISSHHIATMPATNLTSVQFKISPV